MIDKKHIIRLEVLSPDGEILISTQNFEFAKDFFAFKKSEFVAIKGNSLPNLPKGTEIDAIFYYRNGTRIKYNTKIDLASEYQVNFHLGTDYIVLEERRFSYKTEVNVEGRIKTYTNDQGVFDFDPPYLTVNIKNINHGGVFFSSEYEFLPEDIVELEFLEEGFIIPTKILRRQVNDQGQILGYGCKFETMSSRYEEKISRFIFDCQIADRERNGG